MSNTKETINFYGSNGEYSAHLRGQIVEVRKEGSRWVGIYGAPPEATRTGSGSCFCPRTRTAPFPTRRAAAVAAAEAKISAWEAHREAAREAAPAVTLSPGFTF